MIQGKDVANITCLAALSVVITFVIGQTATMISGLPGANYVFTVLYAILTSFSLLVHDGKRWMFFIQTAVFTLLIIPTHFGGTAFNPTSKLHFLFTSLIIDLLYNSVYTEFKKNNKLRFWAILGAVTFWSMNPMVGIAIKGVFLYPADYIATLIQVVLFLYPVIVVGGIVGGWIGYKTFRRIKSGL